MTTSPAPGGTAYQDEEEAARAGVRSKWHERQRAEAVRQAAHAEEERLRQASRASRREARRAARQDRADRAADAVDGAGSLARRAAPVVGAAVPVAMVNGTAFIGQLAYIREHVPWVLPGQVLVAATFESVAVYLAWHAHLAMMKNDSSTRLKLGAQLFALIMGAMNYSHYSANWHPTVMAVGLGLMSLLSPSLWGIYSRRAARDRLMERGLVEEHAVRLGANRWTWHPLRAMRVMYQATWDGENNPQVAIANFEARQEQRRADWRAGRERRASKIAAAEAARRASGAAPLAQPAPAAGAPGSAAQPAPVAQLLPGTTLNGKTVGAIAQLRGAATVSASHEIPAEKIAAAEALLAAVPLSQELPSERKLARELCPLNHDHRRQAKPLLAAARDRREALAAARPRQGSPIRIAPPASSLPGGIQAHG